MPEPTITPRYATFEKLMPGVFGDPAETIVLGVSRQIQVRIELLRKHLLKKSAALFRIEKIEEVFRAFGEDPGKYMKSAINKAAEYVRLRFRAHFAAERDAWGKKWAPMSQWTPEIYRRHFGKEKKKLGVWSGGLLKRLNKRPSSGKHHFFRLYSVGNKTRLIFGPSMLTYKPALYFQTRGPAVRFGRVLGVRPARNFMSLAKWERENVAKILIEPLLKFFKQEGIYHPMVDILKGVGDLSDEGGFLGALSMSEMSAERGPAPAMMREYQRMIIPLRRASEARAERMKARYEDKVRQIREKRRETSAEKLLEQDPTGYMTRVAHERYLEKLELMGVRKKYVPPGDRPESERARKKREETILQRLEKFKKKRMKKFGHPVGSPTYEPPYRQRGEYHFPWGETKPTKMPSKAEALSRKKAKLGKVRKTPTRKRHLEEMRKSAIRGVITKLRNKLVDRWDDDLECLQFMQRAQFHLGQKMSRKRR